MSTTNSLSEALMAKGITPPYSVPSQFQCHPNSLREIIRILQLPQPELERWTFGVNAVQFEGDWARDFNGVVRGNADTWYFITSSVIREISWTDQLRERKSIDLQAIPFPREGYNHFGGGCLYKTSQGRTRLLVPVENRDKANNEPLILGLTEHLDVAGFYFLEGKRDGNAGWCALNPWNGLLYTSDDDDVTFLYGYDVSVFSVFEESPSIFGGGGAPCAYLTLYETDGQLDHCRNWIQGGVFSPNGRLYLTHCVRNTHWYEADLVPDYDNFMVVYDVLTGRKLERRNMGGSRFQEIQGLTSSGDHLYVPMYNNRLKDVDIRVTRHPNPQYSL